VRVPFLELAPAVREIRPELDAAYARVMERGQFLLGEELAGFEREFAAFCGARDCVGVASGLDALSLSLRALDIGPGDEVIVPSNSFIATWLAVSAVGADPVPAEPDPATHNVDPARVEASLSHRTRALIAVHLYGQCADMDALTELAARHGFALVEDAAQSTGALWRGRPSGSLGRAAAFSFYPTKNLGALADAGAVVTSDAGLAERVRRLRNYGSSEKNRFEEKGCNSRLDELQAAWLRAKLPHLTAWNARRAGLAERYRARLGGRDDLVLPEPAPGCEPVWHLFVVRVAERDALREELAKRGIGTAVHYPVPPHLSRAYADERPRWPALPIAEELARSVLSLPLHPQLEERHVDAVCDALLEVLETAS